MKDPLASDAIRWVKEGEELFRLTLQTLHRCQETTARAETLEGENARLRQEVQALSSELADLRAERVDMAETLKAIAEHVTKLATVAIQRLGARGAAAGPARRSESSSGVS